MSIPSYVHSVADKVLARMQRSHFYYERYNNTLPYKINRAYTTFAKECTRIYTARNSGVRLPASPLRNNPAVLIRNVLPREKAQELSDRIAEMIRTNDSRVTLAEKGLNYKIATPLKTFGPGILDVLRSPDLDRALLSFFQGYYRVEFVSSTRTLPSREVAGSWLWHSDSFPPHTCKLFIHLTPANADRGATEFMSLADTMAYRRAGYFGQYLNERYASLEDFARERGLPYRPIHLDAEPGDVTLFDMNYFHRAIAPKADYRDVIQFFLLPSTVPWEEHYRGDPDALNTRTAVFPKDPRQTAEAAALP